ncbi:hypothetical protein F8388_013550 [Cannabis sativa]|uniref:C3H1-type domain-containing protein n=1 Tax=Cannabis sativa TaxID=3483 RepID=A0A7J6G958_CANSA|nr:hypothetical protein F8388_013550 [Cannabis sativa]
MIIFLQKQKTNETNGDWRRPVDTGKKSKNSKTRVGNAYGIISTQRGQIKKTRMKVERMEIMDMSFCSYNHNMNTICKFWAVGQCKKGKACEYRHSWGSNGFQELVSLPKTLTKYIIMNDALFKGNRVSIEHALKKLASRYEETTLTYCAEKEDLINVRSDVRRTSTLNYNTSIIFLVDASWKEGNAGLAVILFDPGAHSWTWSAKSCKADSAVEAEVLAIFWALQLSKDKGHESVTVLSDAQVVANALQARRCPPVWEVRVN